MTLTKKAYVILGDARRQMPVGELLGSFREMFGETPDPNQLASALDANIEFTLDTLGRYGLVEFQWRTPGSLSHGSP